MRLFVRRLFVVWLVAIAFGGVTLRAYGAEVAPSPAPVPSASPGNGLVWRNIGPSAAGGRVAAVTGSTRDPELFYIGTAGGGVWKSTNGAIDWHPVFDATGVSSIGAITISPLDKETVWVGTGEAWPRNDVIAGNGLYLSVDGGQTWKHRGLDGTSQIARIVLDPRNPQRILVAALGSPFADSDERGVYRSDDGGQTWHKTLFLARDTGASDLVLDPLHPDVVYAGMWRFRRSAWHLTSGGTDDGVYKSTDGGQTWHRLTGAGLPKGPLGRIGLAVAPSDPNRIYALIESDAGLLWRSDDAGAHWTLRSTNTLINERPFYYSRIVVDPHDPNHLFSVSVHLAQSYDGGASWHLSGRNVHGDHHDVWMSADGSVALDGNDGGPALSRDGGKTWNARRALTTAQVYHVGFDRRNPYWVCAGLQDNGTWCAPNTTGDERGILPGDWVRVAGGDGTWVWPDPLDPTIVFASSGGGDNGGELSRFALSTQTGSDVSPYLRDQNVVAPRDLQYRFNWEAPIAFSPFEPDTAYYGANVVFRSKDRGNTWQAISPDLTRNMRERQGLSGTPLRLDVTGAETFDTILDIALSPIARNLMWVGTDDGNVALTRDGGATWIAAPIPGLDADSRVVAIEASHASAGRAYVTVDRHYVGDMRPYVYETDNYGAAWRMISAGLDQSDFVHVVREDPHNAALLVCGTEHGIFWSANRGEAWSAFPARLPPSSVHDLRIVPSSGDIIAGTHGRGVWIFDDLRPLEQHAAEATATAALFPPRDAMALERSTTTTATRGAGTAIAGPALLTFYQRGPAAASPALEIVDRFGHTVRHLNGTHDVDGADVPVVPNSAGFNRVAWDLTGDPPTPWARAPKWNRGPERGVPLLSGSYTVVLHRDGAEFRAPLRVVADRRIVANESDERRANAYTAMISSEISIVDDALNTLDNLRLQLPARIRSVETNSGHSPLSTRLHGALVQSAELENVLTSNPQNSQDDDFLRDVLRERLLTLLQNAPRSAPTAEQWREGRALTSETNDELARYRTFFETAVVPIERELERSGLPLDLSDRPRPDAIGPEVDERAARRTEE